MNADPVGLPQRRHSRSQHFQQMSLAVRKRWQVGQARITFRPPARLASGVEDMNVTNLRSLPVHVVLRRLPSGSSW
jgi:hypothetical protein